MTENRRRYLDYMKSFLWQVKRQQRLEKDNHHCRRCYSTTQLTIHHLTYDRFGNEDLDDLITLCEPCHVKEHKKLREQNHVKPQQNQNRLSRQRSI